MIPVCLMKHRTAPFATTASKPSKIERHAQNQRQRSDLESKAFLARIEQERRAEEAMFRRLIRQTMHAPDEEFDDFNRLLSTPVDSSALTELLRRPPVWA